MDKDLQLALAIKRYIEELHPYAVGADVFAVDVFTGGLAYKREWTNHYNDVIVNGILSVYPKATTDHVYYAMWKCGMFEEDSVKLCEKAYPDWK